MIESLLQDLHFGARMLRKNIGFTIVAVLTLALAIGANTAIFSVAQAVFFRSSTAPDADRLMYVSRGYPGFPEGGGNFSYPAYRDMLQQNSSFVDFAAYQRFGSQVLTDGAEPVRIKVNFITPSYLSLQGVKPAIGRLLRPEEDRFGEGDSVIVLSYGFWQSQFAGSPDVIGRTIHVNQHAFTVVGVASAEFFDPLGQQDTSEVVDAYAPLGLAYHLTGYSNPTNRHSALTWGVGLRKPGVSVEQARADIAAIGERLGQAYPTTDRGYTLVARPLKDQLVGQFYSPMWLLIGGSIFILLIGCANVANLLLIRFAARQREFAVRTALGATSTRLARQMFVESFILVALAAVLGALLAVWGVAGLRSWGRLNLPQLIQIRVDPWMLAASALISVVTGFLFGLVPSLAGSRVDLRDALSQGGKQGSGIGHRRAAKALVVSEVCLAVVLLAGAGLLLKSLYRLTTIDLGFNTKNLLTLRLDLIGDRYAVTAKRTLFAKDLIQRLEALPGVQSASVWGPGMIGRATWVIEAVAEGRPVNDPRNIIGSSVHDVNPGALRDLGITILRGRDFTWQDDENAPAVAIISDSVAKAYWPGEDALGKRFRSTSDPQMITVIGIASDARMRQRFLLSDAAIGTPPAGLGPQRDVYFSYAEGPHTALVIAVRATRDPASVAQALKSVVLSIDPALPVYDLAMLQDRLADQEQASRALTTLTVAYAALALFLAALGLYGLLSQSVSRRTRELGIRMALGASHSDVLSMVVREGLVLTLAGILFGLLGALFLSRAITTILFGVQPNDPSVLAGIAALLLAVAAAACIVPARRATQVDPMVALRYE